MSSLISFVLSTTVLTTPSMLSENDPSAFWETSTARPESYLLNANVTQDDFSWHGGRIIKFGVRAESASLFVRRRRCTLCKLGSICICSCNHSWMAASVPSIVAVLRRSISSRVAPKVVCVRKRDASTFESCMTSAVPLYIRSWYTAPSGSVVEHVTGCVCVH